MHIHLTKRAVHVLISRHRHALGVCMIRYDRYDSVALLQYALIYRQSLWHSRVGVFGFLIPPLFQRVKYDVTIYVSEYP